MNLQNKELSLIFTVLFFFLIGPFVEKQAQAQSSDLSYSRNARTFETQSGSLLIKSLAFSCLALEEVPDGIPCNPAMTPKNTKGTLKAEGLISNGYSNLTKTRELLNGSVSPSIVDDLFSGDRVLQVEANADVMFTSRFMNSRLTPYSYKFFSVARNDANPEIELYAIEEQNLTLQSGISLGNFDFGIEIKKMDWKFIRKRFFLFSLATEQGRENLKPQKQSALFLQPAINYNMPLPWKPRIALQIVNLGQIDNHYDDFTHPPELQVGLGVTPPIPYGRLDLLFDYKSLTDNDSDINKFHFGALYRYGVLNLGLGLDGHGGSLGIYYGLEQINAGILFSTTELPWRKDDYFAQTVYVQVGWQL